jgi:uncharacterized membrane protein
MRINRLHHQMHFSKVLFWIGYQKNYLNDFALLLTLIGHQTWLFLYLSIRDDTKEGIILNIFGWLTKCTTSTIISI